MPQALKTRLMAAAPEAQQKVGAIATATSPFSPEEKPASFIAESLRDISPEAWNDCFVGEMEDYSYLLALEEAGLSGFALRYATVKKNGRILAAMPFFLNHYPLDTTLEDGVLRRALRRLRQKFPRFLTLKLACLGSPETECALAGFHPSVGEEEKAPHLRLLLLGFEQYARAKGCGLLGVKDVPARHKALWDEAAGDYTALGGMATASLDIDFATLDDYLAGLSGETRKDMRRKLKNSAAIRVEKRTQIDDVLPEVFQLYLDTRQRSEFKFGQLTPAYFSGVLAQMPGRSFCSLYWQGDTLLAANLMLESERLLLDKFFCMDSRRGRGHNLYFLSWFTNLQYCLDNGIARYQSGQAGESVKCRLGSHLSPNWMLFKHSNVFVNTVLRVASPWLAMGGETHDQ